MDPREAIVSRELESVPAFLRKPIATMEARTPWLTPPPLPSGSDHLNGVHLLKLEY